MGDRLIRRATGRRVLAALALFAVGSAALFALGPYPTLKAAVSQAPFPEESISTGAELETFLDRIGPAARETYLELQLWDVLNPILIGLLTLTLVAWMVGRSLTSEWRSRLLFVPCLAPLADLVENGIIAGAILAFPDPSGPMRALPVIGALKFGGLAATMLLVLALAVPTFRGRAGDPETTPVRDPPPSPTHTPDPG